MLPQLLSYFAAQNNCGHGGFFGFPTWYEYIPKGDFTNCTVNNNFVIPGDLLYVALAAIDILLYIAGFAALIFVVYGGIAYVISQGEPEKTKQAKNTIINAVVGMVIASVAIAVVTFIGNSFGG